MFQEKKALFMYCVSPVHMGAGMALGVIDNPIQRERHTEYPVIAGSGLKGAIRHHLKQASPSNEDIIFAMFGPEAGNSSDHAGAVSFSDAQLVAFPVRSAKRAFVYATSPTALARTARFLNTAGSELGWQVDTVDEGHCRVVNRDLLVGDKVALESLEFTAKLDKSLITVSKWLSQHALTEGTAYEFFRNKLRNDLVLLSDEDFGYFVRNATVVEPHVRISDITGTAEEGGLFYTENLPPESILVSLIMTSKDRRRNEVTLKATDLMQKLVKGDNDSLPGINGMLLQIGGDATTGRGQVVLNITGGK
jgi:CRISPR-associated protein Cmr4